MVRDVPMGIARGSQQRRAVRLQRAAGAALLVCMLAAVAAAAPRAQLVIVPVDPGGAIDWTRGLITAVGAAPGDIRAPSPELARVGAERRARAQARERLLAAARGLRLQGDERLVGEVADADAAVAGRLSAAVARALDLAVDLGSDGSVVLTAGLPLEAVRQAVHGTTAQEVTAPAAGATAPTAVPTALIVDARGILAAPVLGLRLSAGAHDHAGPTVFHGGPAAAAADARRGPRPAQARARALRDGRLVVDLPAEALAAANSARALVIVIIGKP